MSVAQPPAKKSIATKEQAAAITSDTQEFIRLYQMYLPTIQPEFYNDIWQSKFYSNMLQLANRFCIAHFLQHEDLPFRKANFQDQALTCDQGKSAKQMLHLTMTGLQLATKRLLLQQAGLEPPMAVPPAPLATAPPPPMPPPPPPPMPPPLPPPMPPPLPPPMPPAAARLPPLVMMPDSGAGASMATLEAATAAERRGMASENNYCSGMNAAATVPPFRSLPSTQGLRPMGTTGTKRPAAVGKEAGGGAGSHQPAPTGKGAGTGVGSKRAPTGNEPSNQRPNPKRMRTHPVAAFAAAPAGQLALVEYALSDWGVLPASDPLPFWGMVPREQIEEDEGDLRLCYHTWSAEDDTSMVMPDTVPDMVPHHVWLGHNLQEMAQPPVSHNPSDFVSACMAGRTQVQYHDADNPDSMTWEGPELLHPQYPLTFSHDPMPANCQLHGWSNYTGMEPVRIIPSLDAGSQQPPALPPLCPSSRRPATQRSRPRTVQRKRPHARNDVYLQTLQPMIIEQRIIRRSPHQGTDTYDNVFMRTQPTSPVPQPVPNDPSWPMFANEPVLPGSSDCLDDFLAHLLESDAVDAPPSVAPARDVPQAAPESEFDCDYFLA